MFDFNIADLNIVQPTGPKDPQEPQAERCRSLRCKGMYINVGLPDGERVSGDGHFWCARTQRVFGPDEHLVGDGECRQAGRTCYES